MKEKRRFAAMLLVICLLLSACSAGDRPQPVPQPPSGQESAAEENTGAEEQDENASALPDAPAEAPAGEADTQEEEADEAAVPLLDLAEPVGTLGNTYAIALDEISDMAYADMRLYGNALLFSKNVSERERSGMELKLISLEDGSLISEGFVEGGGFQRLQTGDGNICIHDSETGKISLLDDTFAVIKEYTAEPDNETWFLSRSFETLYIFDYEEGVRAVSLTDGSEMQLVKGTTVFVLGNTDQYVLFSYAPSKDHYQYRMCLNLETGELSLMPLVGNIGVATRSANSWLLRDSDEWGTYYIVRDGVAKKVVHPDGLMTMVELRDKLLATADLASSLVLYEPDGTFVSKCTLPQQMYPDQNLVWSGYWDGWFFTAVHNGAPELIFWDPYVEVEGEDLLLQDTQTQVEGGGSTAAAGLYERAEQLSDRFGIEIRIADQCRLEYSHYTSYEVTDTYFLTEALDLIERCLSVYPDGFFPQLCVGGVERVVFELVGGISPREGMNTTHSAAAFVYHDDSATYMISDCYTLTEYVLHHELSHMIDRKLAYEASLRMDALYSEQTWFSLQPEGFDYAYSYTEMPDEVLEFYDPAYFALDYGATYPTEDRATLFGSLMANSITPEAFSDPMRVKLTYYSDCIRDGFDSAEWPEQTEWERLLAQ